MLFNVGDGGNIFMIDEINEKLFILQLFNLESNDVQDVSCIRAGNDVIVDITLVSEPIPCPICGCEHPHTKNYVKKNITHSVLSDRRCTLRYHARRYQCPICGKTYYEHNPFVFKSMKISALTVYKVLDELKNSTETFSSVAKRYHISSTSAASIFDSHVNMTRKSLPEMINFDEVYAFKSDTSKYVCVLLDFETQNPIDVLPSRRYDHLHSYFMRIPKEERDNVKFVCSDMYDCYRSITKACFPNAICIVDHFHVSQELGWRVDSVRIKIMKKYTNNKKSDEYYLLKKFNWIIFKSNVDERDDFDPNAEKKWNNHFKKYMNYYEIKQRLFDIDPQLREVWNLKDSFVDFYDNATIDNALDKLNQIIKEFEESSVTEMNAFAHTLKKWKKEIVNSFHIVGYKYQVSQSTGRVAAQQMKMNNAIIENRNSIIKCIKKNANGYTNWTRFRNRILYVLDKNSTYSMYPIYQEKKK